MKLIILKKLINKQKFATIKYNSFLSKNTQPTPDMNRLKNLLKKNKDKKQDYLMTTSEKNASFISDSNPSIT